MFLEVGRIHLVNGTSSRKFGVGFNINLPADSLRASMNGKRLLWVVRILGNMVQSSMAYKGIKVFLDEDRRTNTKTIRVVERDRIMFSDCS